MGRPEAEDERRPRKEPRRRREAVTVFGENTTPLKILMQAFLITLIIQDPQAISNKQQSFRLLSLSISLPSIIFCLLVRFIHLAISLREALEVPPGIILFSLIFSYLPIPTFPLSGNPTFSLAITPFFSHTVNHLPAFFASPPTSILPSPSPSPPVLPTFAPQHTPVNPPKGI